MPELQVGGWYHFWSTTIHEGVMDYGQLVAVRDGYCRFINAVMTKVVPVAYVVSQSVSLPYARQAMGKQSGALPINPG